MLIPFDCAVNDECGLITTKIKAIRVPGLTLASANETGVSFREMVNVNPPKSGMTGLPQFGIKISRRAWPAKHLGSNVGNLAWERYGIYHCTAAVFLHWLRQTRTFVSEGGYEELSNWWDSTATTPLHVASLLKTYTEDDE